MRDRSGPVNVAAVTKGAENYVFLYDDSTANRAETIRVFGRFAADPALSFTWQDAAKLSDIVRKGAREAKE